MVEESNLDALRRREDKESAAEDTYIGNVEVAGEAVVFPTIQRFLGGG